MKDGDSEKTDGEQTLVDLVKKYDEEKQNSAPPDWLLDSNQPEWLRKRNSGGFEEINFLKGKRDYTDPPKPEGEGYSDTEDEALAADAFFEKSVDKKMLSGEGSYILPNIANMIQADMYPGEYHDQYSVDVLNPTRGPGLLGTYSDEWKGVGKYISLPSYFCHFRSIDIRASC